MPLGERAGDKSESRYCGVETDFNDDMPNVLSWNISSGGFDFVVATLMNPTYRPSKSNGDGALPFAGSDLVLSPSQWSSHVVGQNLTTSLESFFYYKSLHVSSNVDS